MERSWKHGFKKCSDYVEVTLSGDENYDLCVYRAFASLGIEYDEEEHTPTIVHMQGCRVLDQPVQQDGRELPWMISRYVKSVFNKSTHSIKLGVALLEV